MNLNKLFKSETELGPFVSRNYKPDHLTLFVSDFKKGYFKFQTVTEVRFHFFQASNWYFELSEFKRKGFNSGWLISQLTQIPDKRKSILKQFIYNYYQ